MQKKTSKNEIHLIVVKQNDLIQKTKCILNAQEQKFVAYALTCIQPGDEPYTRYRINVSDFVRICGIDKRNAYREIEKMAEALRKKMTWIIDEEGKKKVLFSWFIESEYDEGAIEFVFHSHIHKYLFNLKNRFTQYELENLVKLSSKYSMRIYELLKSYEYCKETTIDLDYFREIIDAESYKSLGIMRQRILNVAINEINEKSDIQVDLQYLDKKGRTVHNLAGKTIKSLKFEIQPKAYVQ